MFDSITDAFFVVDSAWRFRYVNPRAAQLVGRPRESLIGRELWTEFPEAVGTAYYTNAMRAVAERRAVDFEAYYPAPLDIWTAMRIYPLDGGVAVYYQDITARKRAEEALGRSEATYAAVLDASLDAVVGMDHQGLVTDFNAAAERLFGHRREDARGRSMSELIIPPALREAHRLGLERYLATGEARVLGRRIEIDAMRRDGSVFPSELAIVRLPGDPPRFTGFLRDITDRRKAEESLRQLAEENATARAEAELRATESAELADRLQHQAVELEQQTEEAQSLTEELEQSNEVLERTLDRLRGVEAITDAALSGRDYDAMLQELLRRVRGALRTDMAAVLVLSADGGELLPRAADGLDAELGDARLPLGRGIAGTVAATGRALAVDDTTTAEVLDPVLRAHARSVLATPLTVGGRTIGVIHTGTTTPRRWTDDDLTLLGLVADRMAGAVERSRLHEATRAELAARTRLQEALAASEERYHRIFEESPLPMWLYDASTLRFVEVNAAAVLLYGYSLEQFLAMTVHDVSVRERDDVPDAAPDAAPPARREDGARALRRRHRHRTKDGRLLDVEVTTQELGASAQGRGLCLVIVADETERVRADAAAQLLSIASATFAASLDYDTTLSAAARLALPTLGDFCLVDVLEQQAGGGERLRRVASGAADPAQQAAIDTTMRFTPDLARERHPTVRAIRTGAAVLVRVQPATIAAMARDAEHRAVIERLAPREILAVPLTARGRTLGVMTFVCSQAGRAFDAQDVATAEELGRRAGLAVDNALLYAEAQAARERAERANQAKNLFLATMSHELRTPINASLGYGDLLDMGLAGPLTEQQREFVTRSRAANRHLLELVNDILDFSAIEAGQMSLARERCDLARAIHDATTLVAPQAESGGLRLVNGCAGADVAIAGDQRRLRQILVNLLSNAVKFTPRGGTITISCDVASAGAARAAERGGGWVMVHVADTGVGVAPGVRATLFDPFVQGESGHTRTAGGTGLGLAISRQLAKSMGGDLTLERSAPGEGAAFAVSLPLYREGDAG